MYEQRSVDSIGFVCVCRTIIIEEVTNLRRRGDAEGAGWGRGRSRNDVNIVIMYIIFKKLKNL